MGNEWITVQGDTRPHLRRVLTDSTGAAINLTGSTVKFVMCPRNSATPAIDRAATVVDATQGIVEHQWQATDTEKTGMFDARFVVTYSDGGIESFPKLKPIDVSITRKTPTL